MAGFFNHSTSQDPETGLLTNLETLQQQVHRANASTVSNPIIDLAAKQLDILVTGIESMFEKTVTADNDANITPKL